MLINKFRFYALLKSPIFDFSNSIISLDTFWATTKTRAVLECQKHPLEQHEPKFSFSIWFYCYRRKSVKKLQFFDLFLFLYVFEIFSAMRFLNAKNDSWCCRGGLGHSKTHFVFFLAWKLYEEIELENRGKNPFFS